MSGPSKRRLERRIQALEGERDTAEPTVEEIIATMRAARELEESGLTDEEARERAQELIDAVPDPEGDE